MRPVYVIAGGITKFAKANLAKDFRLMVKEAFDSALADLGGKLTPAEKAKVNRQENRTSRAIYRQKHDAQHQ